MTKPGNDDAGMAPGVKNTQQADFSADFDAISAENQIPHMPEPDTRRAAILEALQRGDRLTHADALRRGWGWRLAADIHKLKEYGWPIRSVLIDQGEGRQPIARYWMGGAQ